MVPRKIKNSFEGVVVIGVLVLCLSSDFVTAGSLPSNISKKQITKSKAIDCLSCDSLKSCALRQNGLQMCEEGFCMTILNSKGLVKQRGCSSMLENVEISNYCAENTEKCMICESPECKNDERLSSKPLAVERKADANQHCFQCSSSDECEEGGDIVECKDPKDGMQCYMKFDENADIINMGCMSDFGSETEITELVKQKKLYICNSELCNGFEHVPTPNKCSLCSSNEVESCALRPETIVETVDCLVPPYTQCFEIVSNETNGFTKRGCATNLDGDSLWECLSSKTNGNCRLCTGSGCNNQIIPTNRPKCHRCDSSSSNDCEEAPKSLGICPVYNKDESCISQYEAGVTRRGCSSELNCATNSRTCQICKGDGCNTANLKKRAEEIFGIFQDLPLNCNTCVGEECESNIRNPRKCEGDPMQDCLTVFDKNGKILRRGCELEVLKVHAQHCDANPELCFNCKSNGCNTMTDATKYQECVYCDAAINPDCLFKPETIKSTRKCVDGCVSSLYPRKSNPEVHDFVRTCFEDIESDDRSNCKAENNCVQCKDKNNCNNDILPKEGRLSCLHCGGADCNDPLKKACPSYSTQDQCYIFFSNSNYSALKMGCKSDLLQNEVENNMKQYFLCDGDDCNTYSNLPEANMCYECNSATDVNCAVDPSKLSQNQRRRCQIYPFTECTSWINEQNQTVRGCHYDSPMDVFKKCGNGDPDLNCRLCTESNCNGGIYPSRRQKCHRCNSMDDKNCEASPTVKQACPLYQADDACVTKFLNGVTHRGCRSELSCEGANRKNCQICEKNNCNVINLSEKSIGDPGIFQGLPLNCYHCEGAGECGGISAGTVRKCEGNDLQTCTVAFASNGTVVGRACSDILDTICNEGNNNCYDCKSNGCNTAQKKSDFIDCIYCDAREGDKCTFEVGSVTRKRKCNKGCMTALYSRTDDKEPVYELIRTCLDDKDLDDQEECVKGKDAKCKPCTTSNCNRDNLGERKTCYRCSGENCQAPTTETCRAVMEHDQCFIEYDESNSPVQMGCKSDYDPKDVMNLLYNKRIWLCDGDNCNDIENVPTAQSCVVCNSRTDPKCATKPNNVATDISCNKQPFTQCYMRRLSDGHTERGCASNLEGDEFVNCLWNRNATVCMTCSGANCNKEIFPADRLSCHICSTESTSNCENAPASSEICLKYSANEKCITKVDSNGITIRGCSSQLSCDSSDSSKCQICDSSDCNTSNLKRKSDGKPGMWQDLPLSCLVCSGEEKCATESRPSSCLENNEYCMTVFNANGFVQKRGCSNGVESEFGAYCDVNSARCHNCNSNNCNSAKDLNDYVACVYCDSETNPTCVQNPNAVRSRRLCNGGCMTALYPKVNSSVYALTRTCLDDKDVADREVCVAGDKLCTACNKEAGCNTDLLPQNRWSCNVCQGEDCDDVVPQFCKSYKPNDQCYMHFDLQSNVVGLGCASDLEDGFITDNIDKLYLCDDKVNCNDFENIPKPQRCIECNSMDDTDCASDPENIPAVTLCTALPNTQCATQILADGSTRRGCVSKLSKPQMLDCMSGNATNCEICAGDGCNKEIFPADRRRCHRCDTKENPQCESAPNASTVCPFYTADEFCATKIENGHTYRGCSSDFQCNPIDPNFCRMCKGADNCNTIDLISINIGHPGAWQGLPLNCYHCESDECAAGNGLVRKCEGGDLQTCGTVFDNNGKVVQRSCSLQIYAENATYSQHCIDHPELCKFCKSNGCNTAKSLTDYVDCVFCDVSDNAECWQNVTGVTRRRTCHKKCMTGMYPRKDELNPAFILTRGCLDDMDQDEREACEAGNMKFCKACEDAACNTVALVDTPKLKCHVCNGNDCSNPKSEECVAYREHDQCYALFDTFNTNAAIRMGCSSDLDNSDLIGERRRLFQCDGENCNQVANFPKQTGCVVCDSVTNPLCAIRPDGGLIAAGCSDMPWTNCFTEVNKDGTTRRGCLSDVSDSLFDNCLKDDYGNCVVCDEDNCNTKLFPENRRSCHRCDSNIEKTCENSPQNFTNICPIYNAADSCVTKVEGARTLRGCATDFVCDANEKKTCRICDSDDCNSINLLGAYVGEPGKWQDLPLNCYHCEGKDCANGNGLIEKCENNNLQTCMTVFNKNGVVEKRGCSDGVEATHLDYCEENSDKCFACKSNGCNVAKALNDYKDCYFCDSYNGKGCSVNLNTTNARSRKCYGGCVVALYPRSSVDGPAYELSRSCLDDLDEDDREKCSSNKLELCRACDTENCNIMSVPAERHECNQCMDEECSEFEAQECNSYHPNDQCYILYDNKNSISNMGCRSEYEMNAVTSLIKQKRLILCDGKNCNKPEIVQTKTCLACDSAEDPRCATNPNLVDNFIRCSAFPYTDCGTIVNEDGHTLRNCVADFPSEKFYGCITNNSSGLCETCSSNNCNSIDIFPENRMRCHQCDSKSNEKCTSAPGSNRVCPIYDPDDGCVSDLRNDVTYRGCASSMKCYNENDKRNCRKCKTPGCNTVDLVKIREDGEPGKWQDVPINCRICSGEEECKGSAKFGKCNENPYQNCMTVFNEAGVVIERGCSDPVEEKHSNWCERNPESCRRCNSNGCNVASNLNDYVECLACDTDVNGNCVSNLSGVTKTRKCYKHCMTAMYSRENETSPAYNLVRSCLDDMDEDDREACAGGRKEYCKVCDSAKCNTVDLVEKRLSCNMCQGENCQEPNIAKCPIYRENDQCYILFDEQRDISAMGCRSEFSNADADFYFKKKRLFLCTHNNCNNLDALPKAQKCKICSSRTDLSCATNPDVLDANVTCNQTPFTDCYTLWRKDGSTERGCVSNLYDDEFLECLSDDPSVCKTCKGDECNKEIFPAGRASCHICDSSYDSACEARPDSVSICPKYDPADQCITTWRNGVTLRGCSSSLSCAGTSKRVCSKCTGDGCNVIDLAKRQDDNFGKWQDLPLRCHVCNGDECNVSTNTTVAICEDENEQDCAVVFDKSGKVIARGCAEKVEETHGQYCDENEDHCINCKSNECNSAKSLNEFVDCVYCDAHKDLSCLWQPMSAAHKTRKCRGGCMTALYAADTSNEPAYDLIRTCLDDKESSDQITCSNGRHANCTACTDNTCNTVDFPEDRLKCLYCADGDCEEPTSMKCPLYKKGDQCYIWFNNMNSVSEMGCLSSFRNQELESIIKTKRVFVCNDGDDCNTMDKVINSQKCAVCDSKIDVLCAINAKSVSTFKECTVLPNTGCFSKLNSDGSTSRGCQADLDDNTFVDCVLGKDGLCEPCNGDSCNREIFPADRQQCHTCTSLDDSDCESFPTRMQPCAVVSDTESCNTALSGNETVRGCSSEVYCDASDRLTCRTCFGTECNSIDLRNKVDDEYHGAFQDLPLNCHQCSGEHCHSSLGPVVSCTNYDQQDCKTVFNANGTVRRRGCSDNVDDYEDLYCRKNPELCFNCKSNECNIAWDLEDYVDCTFCNSSRSLECVIKPQTTNFPHRKCYKQCMVTMINNDEIIRSCLDDKEVFNQVDCRTEGANGKECSSCDDGNCNTFVYPRDRLQCHVCTSGDCAKSAGEYCEKYNETDFCFAKYENGKVERMGCGSSVNKDDIDEWTVQKKLYRCDKEDCNDLTKLPSSVSCVTCNSSTDAACAQNPSGVSTNELCIAPKSECVTRVDKDGNTIRGCFSYLDQGEQTTCVANGRCAVCTGDKCNTEIFPGNRRKCHICNSNNDASCYKTPNALNVCLKYDPADVCVAKHEGGFVHRGCSSDLTCDSSNAKKCQICSTDGCNAAVLNGALMRNGSILLTTLLAFISMRLLGVGH